MSVPFEIIRSIMEEYAPSALALSWDNNGLLVGRSEKDIRTILVTLDVTDEVVGEAVEREADLIIAHHPLIFSPLKRITDETGEGRRILRLIRNDISVFAAHSNLDITRNGTNDALFECLGLHGKESLVASNENGDAEGCVGELAEEMTLEQFCLMVRTKLHLPHIRFAGDPLLAIRRVALCSGSAAEPEYFAAAAGCGCQVYVTADITHHKAQNALDYGLALVDGTHYGTEALVVEKICGKLRKAAVERNIEFEVLASQINTQTLAWR